MSSDSSKQGRARPMYICCSPEGHCNGKKTVEKDNPSRVHSSPEEVIACATRALLAQGSKKIGGRMFEHTTDSSKPIVTLDKHPMRAKPGKQEKAYYAKSSKTKIRNGRIQESERPIYSPNT